MKEYHILNGDALAEFFPLSIEGERIICRECMIDGPTESQSLDELLTIRSQFIDNEIRQQQSTKDYHSYVLSELNQLLTIGAHDRINLWFERDLFCQSNLWFIGYYLSESTSIDHVSIVLTNTDHPYSFAHHSESDLLIAYNNRKTFIKCSTLAELWQLYSTKEKHDATKMLEILSDKTLYMSEAIHAYIDKIPTEKGIGKPYQILTQLIEEIGYDDFVTIFKRFNEMAAVYGYGDLQVQRLIERVKSNSK